MLAHRSGQTNQARPSPARVLGLTLAFAALGLLANLLRLPVVFNLDIIFGSIFALTAAALLGAGPGLAAAFAASLCTVAYWNHPYAVVILSAEGLWAGLALARKRRNLVLVDAAFWGLAGFPMVLLFYAGAQGLPVTSALVAALKQVSNGLMNALAADLLVTFLPLDRWLGLPRREERPPLSTVIFDLALVFLMVPATLAIVAGTRKAQAVQTHLLAEGLARDSHAREALVHLWLEDRGGAVNPGRLRQLLAEAGNGPSPFVTLVDAAGRVVASTDPERAPLDALAREAAVPVEGEVFLRLPALRKGVSPMARWQGGRFLTRVPVRGTGWTLLAEAPAGPLQRQVYDLGILETEVLLAFFFLAILVASLVARILSRDSVRLGAFSRDLPLRIEAGEALAWPEPRFRETALVASHFHSTAEALGERIRQVKRETGRRLEAERALIHQGRMAAMGEMIASIAHQWRQPLNTLSMLLWNVKDELDSGEPDLERLRAGCARGDALIQKMSSTVSDFQDFFSPDKRLEAFSARRQVEAALHLMEASLKDAGVAVTLDAPGDVLLQGFPNEYSQAVLNLLANARQAIEAQGRGGEIHIRIAPFGDAGVLTLEDTGGGIPEEILPQVFEPYFSTRPSGTGLGLYICRQIIEGSMGGLISAANAGRGARFTVRVPLQEQTHGHG